MNWKKTDLKKIQNRDPELFKIMFKEYYPNVFNFLIIKTKGNKVLSEELLSDVFYSAIESAPKLKSLKNINAWLLQIASRRLSDYLRKQYRNDKLMNKLHRDDKYEENFINNLSKKENLLIVRIALDNIKEKYQTILKLKYYENRSLKDIAQAMNKKVNAINGLLHRSRQALKNEVIKLADKRFLEE